MTLHINGETLIEKCIRGMYDICTEILVVGGYKAEKIKAIVDKYEKVKLIINKNYEAGMYSSVKAGLEHADGEIIFLTPGDYPFIKKEVYMEMLKAKGNIVVPVHKNIRGHPLMIRSFYIEEICTDKKNASLREFINSKGFHTVDIDDEGILIDIDTIEDYEKACKYKG